MTKMDRGRMRQAMVDIDVEAKALAEKLQEFLTNNPELVAASLKRTSLNPLDALEGAEALPSESGVQDLLFEAQRRLTRLHPDIDQFMLGVSFAQRAFVHGSGAGIDRALEVVKDVFDQLTSVDTDEEAPLESLRKAADVLLEGLGKALDESLGSERQAPQNRAQPADGGEN